MSITYRTLIVNELKRRQSLNPAYSLRAMARDLGISAPQLSAVLSEKKGISIATARAMASELRLTVDETEFFIQSVLALHSRDHREKQAAIKSVRSLSKRESFQGITKAQFSILNEWYYLSILQVFELRSFEPTLDWIAAKLGLSRREVQAALNDLKNAGLLKESNGFFEPVNSFVKTAEIPSRQIRSHLQRMMQMSSAALEDQTIDERDFSSAVFPVDPAKMKEFKKRIADFRESFCVNASKRGAPTEVYSLSIQFFRVSKPETAKEKF